MIDGSIILAPRCRSASRAGRGRGGSFLLVNNGCLTDSDLKLDNKGYYTVVVSHIKPVLHNHNWLPFSSLLPLQEHVVALRNMVPDASFSQSAMNVPADNKWTSASHVMKEYYPTIKRCSRLNYALKGRDCQAM